MKKWLLITMMFLFALLFLSQNAFAAIVEASLSTATPSSGEAGETLTSVAIVGSSTNFDGTTTLSFGSGITVGSLTITDSTHLTANNVVIASDAATGARTVIATTGAETASGEVFNISIASDATLGSRDVTVTNPTGDTRTVTASGAFSVTAAAAEIFSLTPGDVEHGKESSVSIIGSGFRTDAASTIITFTKSTPPAHTFTARDVIIVSGSTIQCRITYNAPIGFYDVEIDQDGVETSKAQAFEVMQAFGGPYIYQQRSSTASDTGAVSTTSTYRIAYVLNANRNVEIIVIDLKQLKPVYRKVFSSGTQGGTRGYNEYIWQGDLTFGGKIGPGAYLVQMISDGKLEGEYKLIIRP